MRYRIFGRAEASGSPVEPFFVDADDEREARNRAAELGTVVDRVEAGPHSAGAAAASGDARTQIPPERQALYYLGMALAGVGLVLFISVFFTGAANFGNFENFQERGRSEAFRAITGMVLMIVGGALMAIGSKGLAGSGLVLDPRKARKDVEPWSRMAGGIVQDTLSEVDVIKKAEERLEPPAPQVKVRCRRCQALNDESARFCNQCGTAL
jgi:hypothetical protein